ncbi:MAG: pyruvate ferredoxin oxidoreductase, partial [Planctomycetota bacterium]
CQKEFEACFGRRGAGPVVPYRMEDAEIALVSMGTTASTVRMAVDEARDEGVKVGALRVRMFRPFPDAVLRRWLEGCKRVGVLDRDISLGHGGVLWSETRGAAPPGSLVQGYILGLGGGDIRPKHIKSVLAELAEQVDAQEPRIVEVG